MCKVDQHALILTLEVSQYPKCYLAQIQSLHSHFEPSTIASYHPGSVIMQKDKGIIPYQNQSMEEIQETLFTSNKQTYYQHIVG